MDDARRHLLQLVQDGHMTPEQASTFLEMMDRKPPVPGPPHPGGFAPGQPGFVPPEAGTGFHPPPSRPRRRRPIPAPPPGGWGAPPPGAPPPPDLPPNDYITRDIGPQRPRRVARAVAHGGQVVVAVASSDKEGSRTSHEGRAPLDGIREVFVEHPYGDLLIRGGSETSELQWILQCELLGTRDDKGVSVDCERRGDRLVVSVRVPTTTEGLSVAKAQLELCVPKHVEVGCEGANGLIAVDALQGRLRLRSGNGDVRVTNHEGAFEVTALNGPVTLKQVRGDGDLCIENGDLDVEESRGRWGVRITNGAALVRRGQGRLKLDVQHGDVEVDHFDGQLRVETGIGNILLTNAAPDVQARSSRTGRVEARGALPPDGRIELRAATGDVTLSLPKETNARVSMQTMSGRIDCGLPLEEMERSANNVSGVLGEPLALVVLETTLGNVAVQCT